MTEKVVLGLIVPASGKQAVDAGPARKKRDLFTVRGHLPRRTALIIACAASLAVIALWEIAVDGGWLNRTFFPSPSTTLATLWVMIRDQNLLMHAGISTLRVWGAFALSAVMAIPLGILMSSYASVGAALEPIVDFIRYLPVPALVPLSIIWF